MAGTPAAWTTGGGGAGWDWPRTCARRPLPACGSSLARICVQHGIAAAKRPGTPPVTLEGHLHASLDSNTLLNLTARTIFEARIVHLLASGWEPGHETLFVAACEVFDWARDSRRIMQFGEAGAVVNRAIDEWKLYESMPATSIGTVKQLIQLVRRTPKPEGTAARNDLLLFHELAGRFYSWLAIIVDRAILQEWSNAAQAELQRAGPGPAVPLHASEGPVEPARTSSWGAGAGWSLALLAYFLIKGCAAFMSH